MRLRRFLSSKIDKDPIQHCFITNPSMVFPIRQETAIVLLDLISVPGEFDSPFVWS